MKSLCNHLQKILSFKLILYYKCYSVVPSCYEIIAELIYFQYTENITNEIPCMTLLTFPFY